MSQIPAFIRARFAWFLFIGTVVSLFYAPMPAAAATCAVSSPTSGAYTVTACFTNPADASTLIGNNTVSASITVSGTSPGIQRVIVNMDGAYLITDFQSPYSFTLPTANYIDGAHTLQVQALMRDGFVTSQASISLTFSNGVTTPPVNTNTFTPSQGTNPAPGQPFVIAAVGDGAGGETNETKVVNLISSWNPNLFLYLGDVYEKGSPLEFYNWYAPSGYYGIFNAITNPTIGNHEYSTGSPAGYFNYWNNIPNYYSFNAGGWHFISLNSTNQFNQYSSTSAQYNWLVQDLQANTAACTIAYYHQPLYNIGPEGATTAMSTIWSLLYSNHVTLVLNGHDHDYQRWTPLDGAGNPTANGITEFVAGTGGHGIQTFKTTDSRLVVGLDTTADFGALRLQLGSTSANFAFINTAGSTLDSGIIPCQGVAAPTSTPTPMPINSPTPTSTPLPPTPTNTPLPATPTNTPLPPTATNTPLPATPTNTPLPPTPTNTPSSSALVFAPVADSYVSQSFPNNNYGTSTSIRVDGSPILNSYIRFNVQGLTGSIQSVTLRVYANSNSSAGYSVESVADNTWGETTITYANAPAISSTVTGSSGGFSTGTWTSVNVTPLVTGNGTYSFALTTASGTQINLASRESGANAEQLVVQLAPALAPLLVRPAATPTPTRAAPIRLAPIPSPTVTRARPTPTNTRQPVAPAATATKRAPVAPKPSPTATRTPTPTPTGTRTVLPRGRPSPAIPPTSKPGALIDQDLVQLLIQFLVLTTLPLAVGLLRL